MDDLGGKPTFFGNIQVCFESNPPGSQWINLFYFFVDGANPNLQELHELQGQVGKPYAVSFGNDPGS